MEASIGAVGCLSPFSYMATSDCPMPAWYPNCDCVQPRSARACLSRALMSPCVGRGGSLVGVMVERKYSEEVILATLCSILSGISRIRYAEAAIVPKIPLL